MIELPPIFEEKLKLDTSGYYAGAINITRSKFDQVFSENKLYFFEEYTDHGIRHINSVLAASANLITPNTYKLLSEKDISILVLSVFLHDLGMHLQPLTFKKMITGGYDDVLNTEFGDQQWSVLWENYLFEAKKFNDQQRVSIFGDASVYVTEPDLNNPDSLTGIHKKLVGEFIRRHHPRIAYEVAFKGLTAHDGTQIDFCTDFDNDHKLLAGLLARSHGMNIRDTFSILERHFVRVWKRPLEIHIVYLMAVLRLADYFQIDKSRVLKASFLTRQFQSSFSFNEHQKHLQTTYVQKSVDDPEMLYITAKPKDSSYFLSLQKLFGDIQHEVDHSWAVLGEVYGLKPFNEQPKLAYRRIRSNIDEKKSFEASVSYVPEKVTFTVDKEVPKLLVGPLYDYDPSFGVRELLQNAIDACWEREFYEHKKGNEFKSEILVKIEIVNEQYLFSITDNGKGMTMDEIKNYFLKVGGSFRKSPIWQVEHLDSEGHSNINKSGRFGIGVLAAYLLGYEIEVKTKSIFSSPGYSFKTSLDQEQIEIIKENDIAPGTTITINISVEVYKKLMDNNNGGIYHSNSEKARRFDKWYVLDMPSVTYSFPGGEKISEAEKMYHRPLQVTQFDVKENANWHELKHDDFKSIYWTYLGRFKETIICNGFVIPTLYGLGDDRFNAPTLVIFDHDAKLPINLSRTAVDFPLSFNDDLELEMYKDIVAGLLIADVQNVFITKSVEFKSYIFNHLAFGHDRFYYQQVDAGFFTYSKLILGKTGFYLYHPTVFGKLKGLKYLMVLNHNDYIENLTEWVDKKYLFEESDVDLITIGSISRGEPGPKDLIKDIARMYFSLNGKKLLGSTKDFYSALPKAIKSKVQFKRDIPNEFLKEGSDDLTLIYVEYTNPESKFDVLGYTLTDLLGDDLLIPYNIEDRKKKFPQAFKELEPYMRKYLEKK